MNKPTDRAIAHKIGCTCRSCGIVYTVDLMVPDDVWAKICPEGGLLCGVCIAARVERMFAGEPGAWRLHDLSTAGAEAKALGDFTADELKDIGYALRNYIIREGNRLHTGPYRSAWVESWAVRLYALAAALGQENKP